MIHSIHRAAGNVVVISCNLMTIIPVGYVLLANQDDPESLAIAGNLFLAILFTTLVSAVIEAMTTFERPSLSAVIRRTAFILLPIIAVILWATYN